MLRAWIDAVRRHGHPVSSGRRDAGVLPLHGLTGTTCDMQYLRDALVADGYSVSVPLLPGRGTRPSDMDSLSWDEWMASALAACYDPAPVRAVAELIHGIGLVRGRLGEIRCPALVSHAVSDRLVPVQYARDLAARLGGPVTTLFLEGTGHAITVDARRRELAEATVAFLRSSIDIPQRAA